VLAVTLGFEDKSVWYEDNYGTEKTDAAQIRIETVSPILSNDTR